MRDVFKKNKTALTHASRSSSPFPGALGVAMVAEQGSLIGWRLTRTRNGHRVSCATDNFRTFAFIKQCDRRILFFAMFQCRLNILRCVVFCGILLWGRGASFMPSPTSQTAQYDDVFKFVICVCQCFIAPPPNGSLGRALAEKSRNFGLGTKKSPGLEWRVPPRFWRFGGVEWAKHPKMTELERLLNLLLHDFRSFRNQALPIFPCEL